MFCRNLYLCQKQEKLCFANTYFFKHSERLAWACLAWLWLPWATQGHGLLSGSSSGLLFWAPLLGTSSGLLDDDGPAAGADVESPADLAGGSDDPNLDQRGCQGHRCARKLCRRKDLGIVFMSAIHSTFLRAHNFMANEGVSEPAGEIIILCQN